MPGFPIELRPLLAIVIVLAIAHMLLKARARRAKALAPRTRRARTRAALAARRDLDASIESATADPHAQDAATLPSEAADPVIPTASGGSSRADADPAEALRRLRERATASRAQPDDSIP